MIIFFFGQTAYDWEHLRRVATIISLGPSVGVSKVVVWERGPSLSPKCPQSEAIGDLRFVAVSNVQRSRNARTIDESRRAYSRNTTDDAPPKACLSTAYPLNASFRVYRPHMGHYFRDGGRDGDLHGRGRSWLIMPFQPRPSATTLGAHASGPGEAVGLREAQNGGQASGGDGDGAWRGPSDWAPSETEMARARREV